MERVHEKVDLGDNHKSFDQKKRSSDGWENKSRECKQANSKSKDVEGG